MSGKSFWHKGVKMCALALVISAAAVFAGGPLAEAARPVDLMNMSGSFGKDTNGFIFKAQYPVAMAADRRASEKITRVLAAEVWRASQDYYERERKLGEGEGESCDIGFETKLNNGRYLSLLSYTYTFVKGAAHPQYTKTGFTFDAVTGEKLPWKKVIRDTDKEAFKLEAINKKILASPAAKKGYLYQDFKGLKKLPENYYLDWKGVIHFVFQPYEIAPYATGLIDINMEKTAKP